MAYILHYVTFTDWSKAHDCRGHILLHTDSLEAAIDAITTVARFAEAENDRLRRHESPETSLI